MSRWFSVLSYLVVFVFPALSGAAAFGSEFPLRAQYPGLEFMRIEDLARDSSAIIVDVRSQFEYDTMHIERAHSMSYTHISFLPHLEKLRTKKDYTTKIVFYCNGPGCHQSYEAGKIAKEAGFENFYIFDGGIGAWARKFPKKTVFFGKPLETPSKLISTKKLTEHTLSWKDFISHGNDPDAVYIDVREVLARRKLPDIKGLRHLPLSRIRGALDAKGFLDKTIYFMDISGQQLQWLQYHLEANGYRNYYFLKEGLVNILGE